MSRYKGKYRIESNRWAYWDYSAPGRYFITICIENRTCILGKIENNKMHLSEYGRIVDDEFRKIPQYHQRVIRDVNVVMPNHVHAIITLGDYDYDNGLCSDDMDGGTHGSGFGRTGVEKIHEFSLRNDHRQSSPPHWWHDTNHTPTKDEIKEYRKYRRKMIVPKIMGKFQMLTSKQINLLRDTPGRRNWQPNYHDHVIRDDAEYHRILDYIRNNPANWQDDNFFTA